MLISLAAALLMTALPAAQERPQEPEAAQLDDVEVVGRRLESRIDDFVDQIIAPAPGRGPARWRRTVCVGAINFRPEAARQIVDRVSAVALELGISPGEPDCKPHILIIATNNGAETATGLVELNLRLFIGGGTGMNQSRAALERFQTGDRAVRWWHVAMPVDADTGARAVRLPGDTDPPALNKFVASRLRSAVRDDMNNAVIVVDTARLGEASFTQLADYVALVALAQIDPEADVRRHDTILNLFSEPASVSGLTAWDLAYLHGLYGAPLDTVSRSSLLGAVERGMEQRAREGQAVEPPAD